MSGLDIENRTRRVLPPRSLFARIARDVLPGWEVSLAFVGPHEAKELNKRLRNKSYIPNVLSYALSPKSGEVIICPTEAARQAPAYEMSPNRFTIFLFIHGLLHIKGWAHGATMEQWEHKLLARYAPLTNGAKNRHRHRHRDLPGQDRHR